jgi:integrase
MRKKPDADWTGKTNIICLIDWANAYLNYAKEQFVDKTYAEKRLAFKMLFQSIDCELPVESLTSAVVLTHITKQKSERSGYAANKDRKNLVAAWNWGARFLAPVLPRKNPCLVPKVPEKRSPRYIPPEEDFWEIYNFAQGQDKVMLLTFLHLAGRRSEIFRLKLEDLDFDNRRIRLSTRKRVGGNLEYDWLPMTGELAEGITEWLHIRPIESDFVFVCIDNTPFSRDYYGKPFKYRLQFMRRLCDKAKVKRFGFHAIRHLTASCLYKQGNSLGVIQAILRHKSPSTTERYLKTLGLEHTREALEGLSVPKKAKAVKFEPRIVANPEKVTKKKKAV